MLIKSALDNEDADARLSAWTKYTRASRELLVADPDMIREAITEGDLDLMLRTAAQRAGIPLPRSAGSKLIDAAIKLKIPKLLSYSFSVWSPMPHLLPLRQSLIAPSLYKRLSDIQHKPKNETVHAAKSVPGRVERRFE
ncbi:MAG TPA: hypothetical protein VJT15_12110 [Pyrinomonadaceae bacterium]|nr:hypothetical protein [Pyrinomonadaceae bacterium]